MSARPSRRAVVWLSVGAVVVIGLVVVALVPKSNSSGFAPLVQVPVARSAGSSQVSSQPAGLTFSSVPIPKFTPFAVAARPAQRGVHVPAAKAPAAAHTASTKPPLPSLACSAGVDNPPAAPKSTADVIVRTRPFAGAHATANFPGAPVTRSGTAASNGIATIPFKVPAGTAAGAVAVQVTVAANNQQAACTTTLTTT